MRVGKKKKKRINRTFISSRSLNPPTKMETKCNKLTIQSDIKQWNLTVTRTFFARNVLPSASVQGNVSSNHLKNSYGKVQ